MYMIRLRSWSVAAFAFVAFAGTAAAQTPSSAVLNTLEVRRLVGSADTGDQARLASHFSALAERHAAQARRHTAMARAFTGNPKRQMAIDRPIICTLGPASLAAREKGWLRRRRRCDSQCFNVVKRDSLKSRLPVMMVTPGLRRFTFTTHVAFLALAIIGLTSPDERTVRGAYLVMAPAAWFVLLPLAHASLLSGVALSLGTTWGLFRHYWVVLKLMITVFAIVILLIYMGDVQADGGSRQIRWWISASCETRRHWSTRSSP